MTSTHWRTAILLLLTIAFTVALTYASVQLPRFVSGVLVDLFGSAGETINYGTGLSEGFLHSHHIRIFGYVSLLLIVALIGVGLFTERTRWAATGAVGLFLPVFGQFALEMSMLAGLGLLRIVWLPIIDHCPALLRFGDVAFAPYLISVYLPALAGVDIRTPLVYGLIGAGILMFAAGAFAWFQTRFSGRRVADIGIYRLSRHPQYVGWIVWTYGLMIYVARLRGPRIQWSVASTLPWIVAALILVCLALKEEISLRLERRAEYQEYLSHTPFLFPIPKVISRIVSAPMRLALRKNWPETGRDVAAVLAIYSSLAILTSLPFVLLDWPHNTQAMLAAFPYDVPPLR